MWAGPVEAFSHVSGVRECLSHQVGHHRTIHAHFLTVIWTEGLYGTKQMFDTIVTSLAGNFRKTTMACFHLQCQDMF